MAASLSAYRSFELHIAVSLAVLSEKLKKVLSEESISLPGVEQQPVNLNKVVRHYRQNNRVYYSYPGWIDQLPEVAGHIDKTFRTVSREYGFIAGTIGESDVMDIPRAGFRGIFSLLLEQGKRFANTRL